MDAHDQTVQVAKKREMEHEQLVRGLVSEAERINEVILGTGPLFSFISFVVSFSDFAGLMYRLLS